MQMHTHAEYALRFQGHASTCALEGDAVPPLKQDEIVASWSRWRRILQLTPQLASLALHRSTGRQRECGLAPLYVRFHPRDRGLQLLALLKVASRPTAVEGVDEQLHRATEACAWIWDWVQHSVGSRLGRGLGLGTSIGD